VTGRTLSEAAQALRGGKTVLVVEDDFDILSSLAEIVREEGFDVLTAGNGYQALEQIARTPPNLIFLDLMMPQMNGWRFVEELRRRYPDRQFPIVLLSAAADVAAEAERLGISFFLKKPFPLTDISRLAHEICD
jgi:CheY-like chemotaxis protein